MKKIFWIPAALIILSAAACKSTPNFADVSGKEWKLIDVRVNNVSIKFDRNTLVSEGFGEIFTLIFDAERISGVGAPNRYFAPYTLDKNQAISIKTIAGTLMAPLRQPEKLKEQDYFIYLQNTYKWNLVKGNLEFSTKDGNGTEATLVFMAPALK
jgi:heat shock protein HslJ